MQSFLSLLAQHRAFSQWFPDAKFADLTPQLNSELSTAEFTRINLLRVIERILQIQPALAVWFREHNGYAVVVDILTFPCNHTTNMCDRLALNILIHGATVDPAAKEVLVSLGVLQIINKFCNGADKELVTLTSELIQSIAQVAEKKNFKKAVKQTGMFSTTEDLLDKLCEPHSFLTKLGWLQVLSISAFDSKIREYLGEQLKGTGKMRSLFLQLIPITKQDILNDQGLYLFS